MSTETPSMDEVICPKCAHQFRAIPQNVQEENARLREELSLANGTIESRDRNIAAMSTAIEQARMVNGLLTQRAEKAESDLKRARTSDEANFLRWQKAEARALEYKTEHAALLGTSQWQETEIADLRDDVKRLMQTVSECEERALAAEKDAGRYQWLRGASVDRGNDFPNKWWENLGDSLDENFDELIDAAIAGAKHD